MPQEPQLHERKMNSHQVKGNCATLPNLRSKGNFLQASGTFPRRSHGCWERKGLLWVRHYSSEYNVIILKGHQLRLDCFCQQTEEKMSFRDPEKVLGIGHAGKAASTVSGEWRALGVSARPSWSTSIFGGVTDAPAPTQPSSGDHQEFVAELRFPGFPFIMKVLWC